jgi:hypothetical protein
MKMPEIFGKTLDNWAGSSPFFLWLAAFSRGFFHLHGANENIRENVGNSVQRLSTSLYKFSRVSRPLFKAFNALWTLPKK